MPCGAELQIGWIPVRRQVDLDDEVHSADHLDIDIRLLPILEGEAQDAIVREELEQRGWERQADGSLSKQFGHTVATLAAGSSTIRIAVAAQTAVKASAEASGVAKEEDLAAQDAIGDKAAALARSRLKRVADDARAELVQQNIDRILAVEADVRADVAEVAKITTKRSLEQRAAQLGAIESVIEGKDANGGYELTITVKT
ncbi:MAG: hypothetical protein ABI867_32830 [Kofleriaceae bacterium]